jgi:hypothetical protein
MYSDLFEINVDIILKDRYQKTYLSKQVQQHHHQLIDYREYVNLLIDCSILKARYIFVMDLFILNLLTIDGR